MDGWMDEWMDEWMIECHFAIGLFYLLIIEFLANKEKLILLHW
jgi:hypothetical protein